MTDLTAEVSAATTKPRMSRRKKLILVIAAAAVVILATAGSTAAVHQARIAELTAQAKAHAASIGQAADAATQAAALQEEARVSAATYLAEVAEPAATAVRGRVGDFSAEASTQLDAAVATLTEHIATAASAPIATAPKTPFADKALAEVIAARYIAADDKRMKTLVKQHAAELERIESIDQELRAQTAAIQNATATTDGAIAESAAVAAQSQQRLLDASPSASAETKAALRDAITALQAVASVEVSTADATVTAAIASSPAVFGTYAAAADGLRASHAVNTAPKPQPRNTAPRYCSRYTAFFGLIWSPC